MDADDRPSMRVLMVQLNQRERIARWAIVDLLEVPLRQKDDWRVVGLDPEDEANWHAWRAKHPEAV